MTHKNIYPERHFFKTTLSNVRVASKLIQQFLPQALRATLDMRTLKSLPNSFVEKDFETALSDSIFSVKMNDRTAYICFIYVEPSIPDYLLHSLILCYTLYVEEQCHKQHPKQKLPFIYALVVSNGQYQFQNISDLDMHDHINVSTGFAEALSPATIQYIDINAMKHFIKSGYNKDCPKTLVFPVERKSSRRTPYDYYAMKH
jgi:Putative transposase, YhgA-like